MAVKYYITHKTINTINSCLIITVIIINSNCIVFVVHYLFLFTGTLIHIQLLITNLDLNLYLFTFYLHTQVHMYHLVCA